MFTGNPHSSFERVSENIRRMPANARPRAKDAAHQAAAADRGLSGACRAVFTFLLDDLYWVTGVSDRNGRLDLCSKTGFDRSTITRAIAKLRDRGHVLVQQKRCGPAEYERNAYTFPHVAAAARPEEACQ